MSPILITAVSIVGAALIAWFVCEWIVGRVFGSNDQDRSAS